MSAFATDPLSPFNDPHRDDAPPWPTTPHSPLDADPNIVKPIKAITSTPPRSANLDTGGPSNGPWGREPQIYGQPEPGLISPRETVASNGTSFEKPEPYLRVRITALDRNRRDILIRFDAQTNLPNFTGTTYRNISRSYAEFQRFYEQIVYSNPQTIIPALPLAQTSAPSDEEDDRLVKVMLQRWFTRVCNDTILLSDEELRSFVESDFGYQPMPRPRRRASSGFSLLGRRPPDEDEQLAQARFELTRLETQYIETAKAVDRLSSARKAMSFAHADMGNKLVDVAAAEVHPPLASAVRKMGRSWHTYADLDTSQEISDRVILGDSLGYQGLNARSAKETLLQRSLVLEEYQEAVKTTIAKRRNIERLKASSNIRPERVDDALSELEEATNVEAQIHRRVEGISQNLHRALVRHSRQAHEDLSVALIEHARMNIMYEKQLLRELESLRPDVKSAADPAPPPTSLPAAANIAPLAINRSATMPSATGFQRPPISSGHFIPPTPSQQPDTKSIGQHPGPEPISAPSPRQFISSTQVLSPDIPVTPSSAAMAGPGGNLRGGTTGPSVPSFPRTSQFVNQGGPESPAPLTPGFPRTNQFTTPVRPSSASGSTPVTPTAPVSIGGGPVNAPAATPITPGFPRTTQFTTPGTPVMTPGFPRTNQFTGAGTGATPTTPGFPKTNQFVGVSSPLSTGGFAAFPKTSQFVPGTQNPLSPGMQGQNPLSPGLQGANGTNGARSPLPSRFDQGMNSPITRSASASPHPSSTPVKSQLTQSQSHSQLNTGSVQYQQPALPSQLQQRQVQQQPQIDPLAGSRIISSQPAPSSPMLPQARSQSQTYSPSTQSQFQSPLSASVSGLPSRNQGFGDPLLGGGGMSQSMFVGQSTAGSNGVFGPLGNDMDPLGGTIRGGTVRGGKPGPKRLDAREAASKLANFL